MDGWYRHPHARKLRIPLRTTTHSSSNPPPIPIQFRHSARSPQLANNQGRAVDGDGRSALATDAQSSVWLYRCTAAGRLLSIGDIEGTCRPSTAIAGRQLCSHTADLSALPVQRWPASCSRGTLDPSSPSSKLVQEDFDRQRRCVDRGVDRVDQRQVVVATGHLWHQHVDDRRHRALRTQNNTPPANEVAVGVGAHSE